jgi:hypothetical protein
LSRLRLDDLIGDIFAGDAVASKSDAMVGWFAEHSSIHL